MSTTSAFLLISNLLHFICIIVYFYERLNSFITRLTLYCLSAVNSPHKTAHLVFEPQSIPSYEPLQFPHPSKQQIILLYIQKTKNFSSYTWRAWNLGDLWQFINSYPVDAKLQHFQKSDGQLKKQTGEYSNGKMNTLLHWVVMGQTAHLLRTLFLAWQ